jgi:putative ABC transport system permease protein
MVVFQFTVAIILIASTLIIYDQLGFMQNQKLGANIDQVIVLKTPAGIRNSVQTATTFKDELQSLPDVKFVTMSATIPGKNYSNASSGVRKFGSNPESGTQGFFIDVDEDYFKLYEIPLIAGRNFSPNSEFNKEIIINEEALKTYGFKNPEEAIHQKLTFDGFEGQNIEIVGVVKDYHQLSLKSSLQPVIFNPVNASNLNLNYFSVKVNSSNVKQSVDQIRAKWSKFYSDQPLDYSFLDEAFNAQYFADQQFGKVFGGFTILAIIISCLGLFSLSASTIQKRTKEIGIRKVNGARTTEVMSMLNRDFIKWVAIAFVIACPIAWYAMHKWLENFAYKTDLSWWVFAAAGGMAMVIALITVSWQSWRAATRNPVESLRYE